jgi:hypothetical protein
VTAGARSAASEAKPANVGVVLGRKSGMGVLRDKQQQQRQLEQANGEAAGPGAGACGGP